MTALNFPDSPNSGDTFANGDVTYTWDGVKWTAKGSDPGHVLKAGDTMTGNLTVPGVISSGTSHWLLPVGTTAQRPAPAPGEVRYNSSIKGYEAYDTTTNSWVAFVGGAGTPGASIKAWMYAVSASPGAPYTLHQYNIANLTVLGAGHYRATFMTPLPSEYTVIGNCTLGANTYSFSEVFSPAARSTTNFEFYTGYTSWSGGTAAFIPRNQGAISFAVIG